MGGVAIVTGASRGIGRATAIRLAHNFRAVALVARTLETLTETADAVRSAERSRCFSRATCVRLTRPKPSSRQRWNPSAVSMHLHASRAPSPKPICSP